MENTCSHTNTYPHFINNLLVYAYNVYHECVLHYQLENRYIHRVFLYLLYIQLCNMED